MQYRSDIDGLRAIAVGSVLIFHAFPALLPGGFLGVDIFFVISGYLISKILLDEIRAGSFSILRFYERRVRRILPVFLLVSAATFLVASAFMLPFDFRDAGGGMASAALFLSNQYFLVDTDYFDGSGELHPFLHTWSLSVEEQFYLLFPLLLLLLIRRRPRWLLPALAVLAGASLLLNLHSAHGDPNFAFYAAPARAWELLAGALVATRVLPLAASQAMRELLAATGLALIVLSCLFHAAGGPVPGLINTLPVAGAALLIHAGHSGNSLASRGLSLKPVVGIGLISYSLYLWHWPVFSLARYANVLPLTQVQTVAAMGLSVLLAWASWRWVENPVRRREVLATRSRLFAVMGALSVLMLALGALAYFGKGLPQRLPLTVARLGWVNPATTGLVNKDRKACIYKTAADVVAGRLCKLGVESEAASPSFLLWGDSHSEALRVAFDGAARLAGVSGLHAGRGSCPPIPSMPRFDTGPKAADQCLRFCAAVLAWLGQQPHVHTVFLHARWALNFEGSRYAQEPGVPAMLSVGDIEDNAQILEQRLTSLVAQLRAMGKIVVIVAGVPEVGIRVPYALAMQRLLGLQLELRPERSAFEMRNGPVGQMFARLQARFPGLQLLLPGQILCPGQWCEVVAADGHPLYSDYDHLSPEGSRLLKSLFVPLLSVATDRNLAGTKPPPNKKPGG